MSESEFGKLIETLTTRSSVDMNDSQMKTLKTYCRKSDDNIDRVFRMLLIQLNKNHSQIRLTTLLIIDEMFNRSHRFRQLVSENLNQLFELCLEINSKQKLPKPKKFSKQLKEKMIEFIQKWNEVFGKGYEELRNAFKYLIDRKIVDFNERTVVNETQRLRLEAEESRKKNVIKTQIQRALQEFNETQIEVNCLLTQINSCFELLLPKMTDNSDYSRDESLDRIKPLNDFSVEILIKPFIEIRQNEDTKAIIDNMRDINLQLSKIKSLKLKPLIHIMSKGYDLCEDHLKRAIDMKCEIESVSHKFIELKIIKNENKNEKCDESQTSDDDFEEVPEKEDFELIFAQHMQQENDLKSLTTPSTSKEDSPQSSLMTDFDMRCNAVLPSGKLCPRKDKVKCPFHGYIVKRDALGIPLSQTDRREEQLRKANALPEWQNPQLLRELKASIGIDLTVKKRKRKKYPELEDIKESENTSRRRLEKRIFKKVVRERIDKDLKSIELKSHSQFEDQWNYALQS